RRYAELFGEPTRARNKAWLFKRLAWRLQALAEGDLSKRARSALENWPAMPTCDCQLPHNERLTRRGCAFRYPVQHLLLMTVCRLRGPSWYASTRGQRSRSRSSPMASLTRGRPMTPSLP